MNTVWVGSLPSGTSEDEVQKIFTKECGNVTSVSVRSKPTDTFAFIRFADPLGFEKALKLDKDTSLFGGSEISVALCKGNPSEEKGGGKGKDGNDGGKGGKDGKGSSGKDRQNSGVSSYRNGHDDAGRDGARNNQRPWDRDRGAPSRPTGGPPTRKIWVGGLPSEVTRSEVEASFSKFGRIDDVRIVHKNDDTFCFITYKDSRDSEAAMKAMNRSTVFGSAIKVNTVFESAAAAPGREGRGKFNLRLRSRSVDRRRSRSRDPPSRLRAAAVSEDEAPPRKKQLGYGDGSGDDDEEVEEEEEDESDGKAKARPAGKLPPLPNGKARPPRRGLFAAALAATGALKPQKVMIKKKITPGASRKEPVNKADQARDARAAAARAAVGAALTPAAKVVKKAPPPSPSPEASESEEKSAEASESPAPVASEGKAASDDEVSSNAAASSAASPEPPPRVVPRATPKSKGGAGRKPASRERRAAEEPASRGRKAESPRREVSAKREAKSDRKQSSARGGRDANDRGRGRPAADRASSRDNRSRPAKEERPKARSRSRSRGAKAVRVDNLPPDMTLDELRATAEDFGQVVAVKISRHLTDGGRCGIVEYQTSADMKRAVQKLDNRRVEGWEKRLHAEVYDA